MDEERFTVVTVFANGRGGGNPAPTVLDADDMTDEEMRAVAVETGHESGFVLQPEHEEDLRLRFWVPNHEMEMCGHATLAALWLLARRGSVTTPSRLRVRTLSGTVDAEVLSDGAVRIRQPAARVDTVHDVDELLDVLGVGAADLAGEVLNASTSRTKTLVPLRDGATLDGLRPDLDRVEGVCDALGSTGLYPYATIEPQVLSARQFPASSGYPEDPATAIAAAALVGALAARGDPSAPDHWSVLQGVAMGRPSRIEVWLERHGDAVVGCWLSGPVEVVARDAG